MFIIFQDNQLLGYLNDEKSAIEHIKKISDIISTELNIKKN